jgi:hypothetical protein
MLPGISFGNVDSIIDAVLRFIALEARVSPSLAQRILKQPFRFFFYSWINQGCPACVVRSSKQFWYKVEGFRPRGESIQFLKYVRSILKLISELTFGRKTFCVGARDKRWVAENYGGQAARIDFAGSPDWIVCRGQALRERLYESLKSSLMSSEGARALATAMPEDLFEGTLLRIRLFLKIIHTDQSKVICSEDLIENTSSACLVLVALERQWKFIYKEHAVPMFLFKDHFSWEYAKLSSTVLIAENYGEHICDEELRGKSLYLKRNRKCRFQYDPQGKVLVCLPFISSTAWLSGYEWTRDMGFYESDLMEIRELIEKWSAREELLVRHHPYKSKGIPPESYPRETYDGAGVREVVFIGWTQGLFECLDAGVPARVLLLRPMRSLNETGQKYFSWLHDKGLLHWHPESLS